MPHRPQTTDGTTASRSITYTIGRDQRRGTTSVSSKAMPRLSGTAMTIAMSAVIAVPYTKSSAPNLLADVFHPVEKIPDSPSLLNQDEACWLVEYAIRTRIARTSRPAASARIWKRRSPSGRRSDRALAGTACSADVTVLTYRCSLHRVVLLTGIGFRTSWLTG